MTQPSNDYEVIFEAPGGHASISIEAATMEEALEKAHDYPLERLWWEPWDEMDTTVTMIKVEDDDCNVLEFVPVSAKINQSSTSLYEAVKRLLECPDLNLDNLEEESLAAIEQAQAVLNTIGGVQS